MNDYYDDVYEMSSPAPPIGIPRDLPRSLESLILAAMRAHPKRRGELRAEWERRLLRIVREKQ